MTDIFSDNKDSKYVNPVYTEPNAIPLRMRHAVQSVVGKKQSNGLHIPRNIRYIFLFQK